MMRRAGPSWTISYSSSNTIEKIWTGYYNFEFTAEVYIFIYFNQRYWIICMRRKCNVRVYCTIIIDIVQYNPIAKVSCKERWRVVNYAIEGCWGLSWLYRVIWSFITRGSGCLCSLVWFNIFKHYLNQWRRGSNRFLNCN
jgi:hypothetical protein